MMDFTRASSSSDPPPVPLHTLTTRQRVVLEVIDHYQRETGEPCSGRYLSRRLALNHTTVRGYLSALHRKGWLRSASSPAVLRRPID